MSTINIASEISGAAAALAGLILVFFGSALSSFDSYDETQKDAVRWTYRKRAWPAFVAFVASILSCGLALYAKAEACDGAANWSAILLAASGIGVFISASLALLEIG